MTSRTQMILKNIKVSLAFFVILMVLRFISQGVFLRHLGADVLGVYVILVNLLSVINLAELGVVSAIIASLYEPMVHKKHNVVSEIVSLQGWFYKKIALVVCFLSALVALFFPLIFQKTDVSLGYIYAIFIVVLLSSLLNYMVGYRQILFVTDLKEYKVSFWIQSVQVVKFILQILCLSYTHLGILWWLFLELCAVVVAQITIDLLVKKHYPWLKLDLKQGPHLQKKHQRIIKDIKQVFFHKVGGQALENAPTLVIYTYLTLLAVAAYNSYMLIFAGVLSLIRAASSGMQAGIGHMIATQDKKQVHQFFWQYFSVKVWIAFLVCAVMYSQTSSFVTLWVGEQYLLPKNAFIWFLIYLFLSIARAFDEFLFGYRLFFDVYAPVIEAGINVGLSFLLGYFFGLSGIIAGVVISLMIVVFGWKPYFLYRDGFGVSFGVYAKHMIGLIFALLFSYLLFIENNLFLPGGVAENLLQWMCQSMTYFLKVSTVSGVVFFLFCSAYRQSCCRMLGLFLGFKKN